MKQMRILGCCLILAAGMMGCGTECEDGLCSSDYGVNPEFSVSRAPLTAYCQANVKGVGTVDMETDYVPNVVHCENGGSNEQGLRVQAVAARTYAYYKLGTGAQLDDGTSDQVYSCPSRAPSAAQFAKMQAAADDTSGVVLQYQGTQVCGFFVAGAKQQYLNEDCRFPDYPAETSTKDGWVYHQKYVTYNYGLSGTPVNTSKTDFTSTGFRQTTLGYVAKTFKVNRGCMGQNGSTCLGAKGWQWREILKFFYGDDIEIVKAEGSCIKSGDTCSTELGASGVIIDDEDGCFSRSNSDSWKAVDTGHDGHLYFAYTGNRDEECVGTWKVNVTRPGVYEIFAYVAAGVGALSAKAPYTVRAKGVETKIVKDLSGVSGWVSLGRFEFAKGGDQWVKLSDLTGEAYTDANGKRVVFDALKFEDAVLCDDACSAEGLVECSGNGIRTCGDANGDGCFEWSAVEPCGEHEVCSNGTCQAQAAACTNACEAEGMRECASEDGYKECGQFDDDDCLEWSPEVACNSGLACTNGACIASGSEPSEPGDETMPSVCLTEIDGRPSTIIDDFDACFVRDNGNWSELSGVGGYDDHLYYAYLKEGDASAVGTWYLNVTQSGKYTIYAYIEDEVGKVADTARYEILAGGRIYSPTVDTDGLTSWVSLGNYELKAGAMQYVRQTNSLKGLDASNAGKRALFDAIKVVPYGNSAGDDTDSHEPVIEAAESDCSSAPLHRGRGAGAGMLMLGILAALGLTRRRQVSSERQ